MTRIAILADIHANIPAFESVLRDLQTQRPDEILLGGDLVGRGPQGTAVVEMARSLGASCVRGNHEDYMLAWRRREVPEAWLLSQEWAAARWMSSELDEAALAYIGDLPFSLVAASSPQIRLVHGSPFSNNEGIGEWTPQDDLERFLNAIDEDILICAHTHRPLQRIFDSRMIVNVGSVGLPFNGDPRAQYALLTKRGTRWEADFRQVAYPHDALFQIYHDTGFFEGAGVTADLLKLEVLAARPYLVPFLKWAEVLKLRVLRESLDDFLQVYDPQQPMTDFLELLEKKARSS